MTDLTLHQTTRSGNCYKISLAASLVGIKIDRIINYDTLKGETRSEHFLSEINGNGKVPVLQIGPHTFMPESNAAMYYIADKSHLIPTDRLLHAQMLQWMFFEQYTHEPAIATLRFWVAIKGLENCTIDEKNAMNGKMVAGWHALDIMEMHLMRGGRKWFVGDGVTLADLALFAYTHVAHESTFFDLMDWPNVRDWCERVKGLNGFVSMV
ncbi:uncharacterized protein RHO25_003515 [Cercospora beticola]|uniref:Glutathione S-transferase n=1 Tax=Cercospora beticola TaxID=122368 RepID=A0ABZ0NH99_CERBT|nr:hypothetical protein RHO25_003515 [Cercospora beticola]CAK1360198.1 unnamed protein product [Cercospora beticola]